MVGTLFVSVGANATESQKELYPLEQNINSATNNLSTSQVQVDPQQKTEQIQNPQTTMDTSAQNGANEQQNEYYYNTAQAMSYNMTNEEPYTKEWDVYRGWYPYIPVEKHCDPYNHALWYWYSWQYMCPNCAYPLYYGAPER